MDIKVWMYLSYLVISVGLTVWVAGTLSPTFTFPAPEPDTATETAAEAPEAPSVPLFELDPEERLLVAGGLPDA